MRMWNLKSAQVIPVIVGALGGVTRKLGDWVGKLHGHFTPNSISTKDCTIRNSNDSEKSA